MWLILDRQTSSHKLSTVFGFYIFSFTPLCHFLFLLHTATLMIITSVMFRKLKCFVSKFAQLKLLSNKAFLSCDCLVYVTDSKVVRCRSCLELALSNNSAPPKRHNRFTDGAQNKTCSHCKKTFPSHASMLIHMRTHTGQYRGVIFVIITFLIYEQAVRAPVYKRSRVRIPQSLYPSHGW